MIPATDRMRQAYLMAALDVRMAVAREPFVSRSYAEEKVSHAFKAETEDDLLGRLDLQRREMYYRYYKELISGLRPR
jgi:hypothetical protein